MKKFIFYRFLNQDPEGALLLKRGLRGGVQELRGERQDDAPRQGQDGRAPPAAQVI